MGTPNKQLKTGAELESLLEQLEDPFDPSEIKWRVTHTTRDGGRGAVVAFADQRACTDRLNRVFTPSGWTRTYDVSEVTSLSRIKKEKVIQTGKVLVTCALTIGALGTHTGCGEEWADEENALTSAEAQAFKRASSCFGLGRWIGAGCRRLHHSDAPIPDCEGGLDVARWPSCQTVGTMTRAVIQLSRKLPTLR